MAVDAGKRSASIRRFAGGLRTAACALFFLTLVVASQLQAQTFTVLHTFTGGQGGSNPESGLTMDRAGNLYGTASAGGAANHGTVFKITP